MLLLLARLLHVKIQSRWIQPLKNPWIKWNANGSLYFLPLFVFVLGACDYADSAFPGIRERFGFGYQSFVFFSFSFFYLYINVLYLYDRKIHRAISSVFWKFLLNPLFTFSAGCALTFMLMKIFPFVSLEKALGGKYLEVFYVALLLTGGVVFYRLNFFVKKEQRKIKETQRQAELHRLRSSENQARLQALTAQINPHFLYNSLNSIAGLSHVSAERAERMALNLSNLLRSRLEEERTVWSVGEELDLVDTYLAVEQERFGDELQAECFVEEELREVQMPRFGLQTLVENAMKHGISKREEPGGLICINGKIERGKAVFSVFDNGPDFPKDWSGGHGLQSLQERFEILYGDSFRFSVQSGEGKAVVLEFPLKINQHETSMITGLNTHETNDCNGCSIWPLKNH